MALFFHFIHLDHNARGMHFFLGLIGYIIFFISDCVEMSDHARTVENDAANITGKKMFQIRVTALVFAAANCILLAVVTFMTFPTIRDVPKPGKQDATANPPSEDSSSSSA